MKLEDEQVEKLTPIEYLAVTSAVPELDQVQIMTMGDLTRDAATLLLDAGCSKCQLLKLYGIRTPGGPHYKLLARVLDGSQPGYSGKTVDADGKAVAGTGKAVTEAVDGNVEPIAEISSVKSSPGNKSLKNGSPILITSSYLFNIC